MPSLLHEATLSLFRDRPTFAAELLTELLATPVLARETASVLAADLGQLAPTELRADLVLRYDEVCVIVEVQRGRDPHKRGRWPVYVATVYERFRCPVLLLVVAPTNVLARWCRRPIEVGGSFVLTPLVLGPDAIPHIDDEERARASPELAVLSAVTHAHEEDAPKLALAALGGLLRIDEDRARVYADLVLSTLPAVARKILEEMMTQKYEYRSDFAKRYVAEGKAIGEAVGEARGVAAMRKALVSLLELRGLPLDDEQRGRIGTATLAMLACWIDHASHADSAEALLAER